MHPSASTAGGSRKTLLTREHVITKIQRWNALFGEPPSTADWNPSLARWRAQEWRIERYRQGDPETGEPWPSLNAAKRLFDGSFDAAVREAGLVPHRPGPRRRAAGAALGGRVQIEQREPMAPRDVEAELLAASERVLEAERRAQRAEARVQRAVDRAERAEATIADARERVRTVERRAVDRARIATAVTPHRRPATDERAIRAAQARAARAEQTARDAEAHAAELSRALEAAETRTARVEAARAAELAAAALAHETTTNGNGNGTGHLATGHVLARRHTQAATATRTGGHGTLVEHRLRAAEQRAIAAASAAEATRACDAISARRLRTERDEAIARAEAAERRVQELEAGGPALSPWQLDELRDGGTGPVGPGPLAEAVKGLAAARASKDRARVHAALTQVARTAVRWRERL